MNYTEKKQKTRLLMLIDFEKAFDSISWKFMYEILIHNFSSEFIKWINIFNTDNSYSIASRTATIRLLGNETIQFNT